MIFANGKKIIVGTSDAWSPSCFAHWLSVPTYYIENWLISKPDKHTLHYFNRFLVCQNAVICPRVMWGQHRLKLQLLQLLQLQHHPSLPRHLPLLLRLRPITPIQLRICLPGNQCGWRKLEWSASLRIGNLVYYFGKVEDLIYNHEGVAILIVNW